MMINVESTRLHKEIFEQPSIIHSLAAQNEVVFREIKRGLSQRGIKHVVIAARGASDNAGRYAKYLFGGRNHLVVSLATPSLFTIYDSPPDLSQAMVLGISQSGQSPDIVQVVQTAQEQGALTVAICNNPDSLLAKTAEIMLDIHAGPELSVAATKTYTAQLALIAMLSNVIAGKEAGTELETLPEAIDVALSANSMMAELAAHFWSIRHIASSCPGIIMAIGESHSGIL